MLGLTERAGKIFRLLARRASFGQPSSALSTQPSRKRSRTEDKSIRHGVASVLS